MMAPKVSVIVPVFNAERCLHHCLNALCRQTLRDIEIICIDDGSADSSEKILQEYAARDDRVKLITLSENKGAAVARNRGIEAARGEYLGFVDSDDHPCLDFYEKLYVKACESDAGVVKGNYRYWGLDGKSLPIDYWMNEAIHKHGTNFSFAFCSAIYKKQLLFEQSIRFPEGFIDLEDPIFTLKVALYCDKIEIVDDAEINIVINQNSATFGSPNIKRIAAKFKGLSHILDMLNGHPCLCEESYAFVTAFWFNSVVTTSLLNKTEQAYRLIRDGLQITFAKVKLCTACSVAFQNMGLSELFSVLSAGSITKLATYLMQFYESKVFTVNHLALLAKIKKETRLCRATVVIPLYAEHPDSFARASLRQCLSILGDHPIVFFGPESLNTANYEDIMRESGGEFLYEGFPDIYFESPYTYSKLMLNADFYSRFSHSKTILVYQLDCWVFRDELKQWCAKEFDYIGAPWFEGYDAATEDSNFIEPSGNGGFSLRNITSFLKCLRALETKILANGLSDFSDVLAHNHEDYILVNVFPAVSPSFSIAPTVESMYFAFEVLPERLYALTGDLPFGCHGFNKYGTDFWKKHIIPWPKVTAEGK